MSYFADLTAHTYTPTDGQTVLNVGWLDCAHGFRRGGVPAGFIAALEQICERPVVRHRGFHVCEFCSASDDREAWTRWEHIGSGVIRVIGDDGVHYAAPTMICHYVAAHGYQPPDGFVKAVLRWAEARQ